MHHLILITHLLGACIWVGGHLILAFKYLPEALKKREAQIIASFEQRFEPIGIPALLVQIITGFLFLYIYKIPLSAFWQPSNHLQNLFAVKFYILLAIVTLAIHAKFFIISKLNQTKLNQLAWHIIAVTLLSVTMLVVGSFARFGGL